MLRFLLSFLFALVWLAPAWAYEYPFKNPYEATVLGTLPRDQFPLESVRSVGIGDLNPLRDLGAVGVRELLLHDRPVPDILWYDDTLQYSLALQRTTAPLLFIIAGTGSSYDSATCRFLQAVFHRAGFHVVSLSSPTYPNFVVSASTSQAPGFIPQDVADLYQGMDAIVSQIGRDRISSYNLTGYSLGGTQSAFLAELDTREKRFGFDKVMLLNPAVSLLTSATTLVASALSATLSDSSRSRIVAEVRRLTAGLSSMTLSNPKRFSRVSSSARKADCVPPRL